MAEAEKDPIEIEIPDLKKAEKSRKKKGLAGLWGSGGSSAAAGGAGSMGTAAQSGGLLMRLASLLPGLGGGGLGFAAAGVGMVGLTAFMTLSAINANHAKVVKKPRPAVGGVQVDGRSARQDSSLALLSGANSGADPFGDEAKRLKAEQERKAAEEAAAAKAKEEAAAQAQAQAQASAKPAGPTAQNPFGERRLAAKPIGGLTGSLGAGGGSNLGRFGPKGVSAEGINGSFQVPTKGFTAGKVSDSAHLSPARVKTITAMGGATGDALHRAAILSQKAASYGAGNAEGAKYAAAEAFEPGAGGDKILANKAAGAGGGTNTPGTASLLSDGGNGGGDPGKSFNTNPAAFTPPDADISDPPWVKFIEACKLITSIAVGLLGAAALLDAAGLFGEGAKAIIGGVVMALGGIAALLGSLVGAIHHQTDIAWLMGLSGVAMVTCGAMAMGSGTGGALKFGLAISGIGQLAQGFFANEMQKQQMEEERNNPGGWKVWSR